MNIKVTVRHDTSGGGVKNFVEEELARLQDKYEIIGAEVIIDQEGTNGYLKTADLNVSVKGAVLHVKETADDVNKAIDLAVKDMEKQLKRYKELHLHPTSLRRQQGQEEGIAAAADTTDDEIMDEDLDLGQVGKA